MYVGGRVGSGKFVLANGSVSSKYWTLQVNAILTEDSVELDACVLSVSLEAPCGGVLSRDHKSRRFVRDRELFLKSLMLDLRPEGASSMDSKRRPFHMKTFLSRSNKWIANQISSSSITNVPFPRRNAKWPKFEPGFLRRNLAVTNWGRLDYANQLISIGVFSVSHYDWFGANIKTSHVMTSVVSQPNVVDISVGSRIRRLQKFGN